MQATGCGSSRSGIAPRRRFFCLMNTEATKGLHEKFDIRTALIQLTRRSYLFVRGIAAGVWQNATFALQRYLREMTMCRQEGKKDCSGPYRSFLSSVPILGTGSIMVPCRSRLGRES